MTEASGDPAGDPRALEADAGDPVGDPWDLDEQNGGDDDGGVDPGALPGDAQG